MFVPLKKDIAPPTVIGQTGLPLRKPSLHDRELARRFPWMQALIVADGAAGYRSPVIMGLDEDGKQGSPFIAHKGWVLQSWRRVLERRP